MKHTKRCASCGGTNIRTTTVASGGGYSPELLPGTHSWWTSGKLEVFICTGCGHFQYFVPADLLAGVVASEKFRSYP
jgi:hypothetical protein